MTEWVSAAERVPLESDGEVFVRFADGSIGTAWATYWHGASNDFAHWTHPDPDEDRAISHWMKPPGITAQVKEGSKCKHCGGSGVVMTHQDDDGPEQIMHCNCEAGAAHGINAQVKGAA